MSGGLSGGAPYPGGSQPRAIVSGGAIGGTRRGALGQEAGAGELVLVTGGVRSGKSAFAERFVASRGGSGVAYVATARVWDDEMAARVARHRAQRPASWHTVEAPLQLDDGVAQALARQRVVLVDSLDFWVSNRLLEANPVDGERLVPAQVEALEAALVGEVALLAQRVRRAGACAVLVTLEAGMGVVPPYPLGRAFRDLLGRVNTTVAAQADYVYLMVAGLPVDVKRLASGQ